MKTNYFCGCGKQATSYLESATHIIDLCDDCREREDRESARLAEALEKVDRNNAKGSFTELFHEGCRLLELDDSKAAEVFDTSRPNANRWRNGKAVPPAAVLVLRFMSEEVAAKIKTLKKLHADESTSPREAEGGDVKQYTCIEDEDGDKDCGCCYACTINTLRAELAETKGHVDRSDQLALQYMRERDEAKAELARVTAELETERELSRHRADYISTIQDITQPLEIDCDPVEWILNLKARAETLESQMANVQAELERMQRDLSTGSKYNDDLRWRTQELAEEIETLERQRDEARQWARRMWVVDEDLYDAETVSGWSNVIARWDAEDKKEDT